MRLDDPIISGSIEFITGGVADYANASVRNLDLAENADTITIDGDSVTGSLDGDKVTLPASSLSGALDPAVVSIETASYAITASFALNAGAGGSGGGVVETATVSQTFTNTTSVDVNHNFDSQNVIVSVYSGSDTPVQIIPGAVTLTDDDNLNISFPSEQSGHVVVAKGGHIVSGSVENAGTASYISADAIDGTVENAESASILSHDSDNYVQYQATGSVTDLHFYINDSLEMKLSQSGELHVDNDIVAFSNRVSSDERLKENIQVIGGALDKLQQLNGVEFDWKKTGKHAGGVIAQNVQQVLPHAVKSIDNLNNDESHLTVDYNSIIGLLIESIKELNDKIDNQ